MSIAEQQLASLQAHHPGAAIRPLPSGADLVSLPRVALPKGWNFVCSTLWFLAPVGYPYAAPDCFWADEALRLANGNMPQNTAISLIPEVGQSALWFSWHLAQPWNPNINSLSSWAASMVERLRPAR